jgi:hypothetical protein
VRRKPQIHIDPRLPELAGPTRKPPPTDSPEAIQPFLKSGGLTYFIVDTEPIVDFDPRTDGVQLVTYVYVPIGYIGFLKQLRVAPFIAPVFADPWDSSGFVPPDTPSWRTWTAGPEPLPRAAGTHGVWTTPFGWESYFDQGDVPPMWRWHLRFVDGNIDHMRMNTLKIPPFSTGNPASWLLVPDIPVPRSPPYTGGIPGRAVGPQWSYQRMQVLQSDELTTHVMIPQNTTLCLFTEWTQQLVTPEVENLGDEGQGDLPYGLSEYPLLPSFGQLHGYMQAIGNAEAVNENGRYGWGG